MRINFGSTYKEVDKLLRASLKPVDQAKEAAFERSLGTLISQPIETAQEPKTLNTTPLSPATERTLMDEARASYLFNDPGVTAPEITPLQPFNMAPVASENGVMDVKTPTLLKVKRVELDPAHLMMFSETASTPLSPLQSMALQPGALQSVAPPLVEASVQSAPLVEVSKPAPLLEVSQPARITMPPQLAQREILSRLSVASEKIGLDPALAKAVVNAESGFNVLAVSSDGHNSKGLFQLLDSTGQQLLARADDVSRRYDPFDPDLNMELGTSYLRYLHDIFRTPTQLPNARTTKSAADERSLEQLAVAAFNAGEGRVASAQHRTEQAGHDPAHYDNVAPFLPRSTREYVARVVRGKRLF